MASDRFVAIKDPSALLDYTLSWAAWLGTDTITSVAWTVPTGLTKPSNSNTTTTATVWLSGGTAGATYSVVCEVTTTAGRRDQRTITIKCQDR
jgi:hypothetical protein